MFNLNIYKITFFQIFKRNEVINESEKKIIFLKKK